MAVFTVPADTPFLAALARGVLAQYGADPLLLPTVLVLLPNRRACRGLREAFLATQGGKPLLLPRIQPIGEVEEEAGLFALENVDVTLPPAMPPLQRELMLTRLVVQFMQDKNVAQAAALARQLARFLDDVAREGLSLDSLAALVPEELSKHWQQTLDFLKIISQHWPAILTQENAIDPVDRRNRQLRALAAQWKKQPPAFPIIAAGSTGSQPATAALIATIARLPQGMVVLPGLDKDMPARAWDMIDETHPHHGLRQLLERMEMKREEVKVFPFSPIGKKERMECLCAILHPPEATAGWAGAALPLAVGLEGVGITEADTLLDEARMIAVALREVLETPGKTAALVTPDRRLARMVAAQLQRFGVAIDDSAGRPLADTPPGVFLRLCIAMIANAAAPADLLALLRHPLAGAGMDTPACRALSRRLENDMLRGIRRTPGLAALAMAATDKEMQSLLDQLNVQARPLVERFAARQAAPLATLLKEHMAFAEWLARTDKESGASRLWAGEAGSALAEFTADLMIQAPQLDNVDPFAYPALFETLLAGQVWRPRYGQHPRLHILSPIEARLLQFDKVILGGMNEGTWPAATEADPWMSRPMRKAFGLPLPERAIGMAAHDMLPLAAAPEVLFSRARKDEGTPTTASRWLVRLQTLVAGLDKPLHARLQVTERYRAAVAQIDAPLGMPETVRPAPCPPLSARPRSLRVTAIDHWLKDPYRVYAQYILRLKKLDALDEEPDAADFGKLVHSALERFVKTCPAVLPENALDLLLAAGRMAFAEFIDRPGVAVLWWPRFEAIAEWVIDEERARRPQVARVLAETKGQWKIDALGGPFTLTTHIDRIEVAQGGSIAIADYKTGIPPTGNAVARGEANQLPLEALVLLRGTVEPPLPPPLSVTALEYWKLSGRADACATLAVDAPLDGLLAEAEARLAALIVRFDQQATAYIAAENTTAHNDYEQLTRRQEWEAV